MADLSQSKVKPWITNLYYQRAISASAGNTRLLHQLNQQLHVPMDQAKEIAEDLLDGQFVCPLGGEYQLVEDIRGGALTWQSTAWAKRNLHSKHRDFLRGLPWTASYRLDGLHLVMIHAGLQQLDEWYTPEEPDRLAQLAAQVGADVIVLGHTHQPFVYEVEAAGRKTLLINPGAVGRALDGDPRAAYAIYDTSEKTWEPRRVEYNIPEVQKRIREARLPEKHALRIAEGW